MVEATEEWRQARHKGGIEGKPELKRAHLGSLRVRGDPRVRLAVYLKALANFKRGHAAVGVENTAQRASGHQRGRGS